MPPPSALQQKFRERLQGSRFRMLNETLYTGSSAQTGARLSREDYHVYHEGFRAQVAKWPENPVEVIIARFLRSARRGLRVGDFGCGEARIAAELGSRLEVHSFDIMPSDNPLVVTCDMAHTPLGDGALDLAVFSLSLMGTNWLEFLKEAARVLRVGGRLVIAEVKSRFVPSDVPRERGGDDAGLSREKQMRSGLHKFVVGVSELGFRLTDTDLGSNKMFVILVFERLEGERQLQGAKRQRGSAPEEARTSKAAAAAGGLNPIPYKRR